METWRGGNSGPYMHSLHSSFAIGAFITPLLCNPFISTDIKQDNFTSKANPELSTNNNNTDNNTGSQITTLYAIHGFIMCSISLCYLYIEVRNLIKRRRFHRQTGEVKVRNTQPDVVYSLKQKFLSFLLFLFVLGYVGSEFSIMSYLPIFGVESELKLTKEEGNNLFAWCYLAYALSRILSIFVATKLRPTQILIISGIAYFCGCLILLFLSQKYIAAMQIGFILIGAGQGPMYANLFLWLDQYVIITGKLTASINMGAGIGINVAPLLVGNNIEETPMVLVYVLLGVAVWGLLIFIPGNILGHQILKEQKVSTDEENQTMNPVKT